MKKNAALAAYMNCDAEGGLDLDRFVEHGGRMLGLADFVALNNSLADLRKKISTLSNQHSYLARQLEFLMSFYQANPPNVPDKVRNETIFALLYAVKEVDLVPDDEPGCCPMNCGSTLILAVPTLLSRIPSDATKRNVSVP